MKTDGEDFMCRTLSTCLALSIAFAAAFLPGNKFKVEPVESTFAGSYEGRNQPMSLGSCVHVEDASALDGLLDCQVEPVLRVGPYRCLRRRVPRLQRTASDGGAR